MSYKETNYDCILCDGKLLESNRVLLSYPVQYQYKCEKCNNRYIRTDGTEKLYSHFDQQYGGD